MNDISMTTMKVKQFNKHLVYNFIYNERTTCKLYITNNLNMGLSTVTQNLKILEQAGLICKNGYYESTGGRKADAIEIVKNAKIAIGVAILKDTVHIVTTNLYGDLTHSIVKSLNYIHNDEYYKQIGHYVNHFILDNNLSNILGVSIATQGIISKEGDQILYGKILDNNKMCISDFTKYIPYPCRLEHDSKSAASLELWRHKHIKNGFVLLLNRNLGGCVFVDGAIQNGENMHSGLIEHLTMNVDGAICYCGKRGCLETYCSANSLELIANMPIKEFFEKVYKNDERCVAIWKEYLNYLAMAIQNLSVIIDGKFIISGYIAPFFKETDLEYLLERINTYATFPLNKKDISFGISGEFSQAVGASLYYIENFLKQI